MSTERGATGLVSVIIPTYRRAKEVRVAAESALAQTWTNLEVLVVSDGPDADTREAMKGLDSRLRYLELPENVGPAQARNVGVAASAGEWITFLDDDDLMLPRKVEAEMQLADRAQPWRMISCRTLYRRGDRDDAWPDRPIAEGEDIADYILRRPSLARPARSDPDSNAAGASLDCGKGAVRHARGSRGLGLAARSMAPGGCPCRVRVGGAGGLQHRY